MNSYRNVNEDKDKSSKYKRIIKKEQCQLGMIDNVAHDMKKIENIENIVIECYLDSE